MNNEEKELIIDLLFKKYKENKDKMILDLIKKVEAINFSVKNVILTNSRITSAAALDFNNLSFDTLDLSNTNLLIEDGKVKISNVLIKKE